MLKCQGFGFIVTYSVKVVQTSQMCLSRMLSNIVGQNLFYPLEHNDQTCWIALKNVEV